MVELGPREVVLEAGQAGFAQQDQWGVFQVGFQEFALSGAFLIEGKNGQEETTNSEDESQGQGWQILHFLLF